MRWTDWKLRLRALFGRERVEQELDEEVAFHLAMEARKYRAQGLGEREAQERARREFGGMDRVKEECRDARGTRWMEMLAQDAGYAVRSYGRTPGFAVTVVATIALGLGLNTALFTVFNAYVLRPLAVREPDGLYQIGWGTRSGITIFTGEDARKLRALRPGLQDVLAFKPVFAKSGGRTLFGNRVSGNYFSMLGVGMAMGRPFEGEVDAVVLSYSAWKNKFSGDGTILGKTVPMFGGMYEVAGVAAPGFEGVGQIPADFWVPEKAGLAVADSGQTLIGRLAPGVGAEQAKAALLLAAQQLTAELPDGQRATSVALRPNATTIPLMPETVALFVPVGLAFLLVLLIACANVASMMTGRAMARRREMSIRLSLGAGRGRLIGQLLVEGVVLAAPAAVLGFWVSGAALGVLLGAVRSTMPPMLAKMVRFVDLTPDARVFVFLFGAALLATVVFALLPALQATRTRMAETGRPSRLRRTLVVTQVTVCALLLICAGVLLRASGQMAERDPGFGVRSVAVVGLNQAVRPAALAALRAEPWSERTAVAWRAPFTGPLRAMTAGAAGAEVSTRAGYNFVSPDYFPLLGIPIVRGRNFTPAEAAGEGAVVVVSEATAKLFWPGEDAVGRTVRLASTGWQMDRGNRMPKFREAEVVGVARDVMSGMVMEGKDATCLYFPTSETGVGNETLLVRMNGGTGALETFLETRAPSAILRVTTLEELFATQVYPFQVGASVSTLLGVLALLLTVSGLYGVLSYMVTQRRKEIGVRMALGATVGRVVRMVMWESGRLAAVGAGLGCLLAGGVSWVLQAQVEGVSAFDPRAYAGGLGVVVLAALAAAVVPSRRAAKIEPSTTLRTD